MMKPEKYNLFEFIVSPFIRMGNGMKSSFKSLLGYWKCTNCELYFSPRVKKYKVSYGETGIKFSVNIFHNCSICDEEIKARRLNK